MKYAVGQVVYVVLNKKNQVYPMRIVEVINKKTLDGEATQYLMQAGSDPNSTIMMDKLDGEVFVTPDEVLRTLVDRASSQIKKLVQIAVTKSKEWYSEANNQQDMLPPLEAEPPRVESYEEAKVMLPDGTVATVKMPAA